MEEEGTLIQKQEFNSSQSNITIKLIGDANDVSEIVNDINSQYHLETQLDNQTSMKTKSTSNYEPSKKKLRMKEEVLPQRVILVLPKNLPSHYLLSPQYQNKSIYTENSNKNSPTNFQFEDFKINNNQKNNKVFTQNIVDNKKESNLSPNLNVTCKESVTNTTSKLNLDLKDHTKTIDNIHKTENINLNQIKSQQSSRQLYKTQFQNSRSVLKNPNVTMISKHVKIKNPTINEENTTNDSLSKNLRPLKRKLSITENTINFNTSTQNLDNLQNNNSAQDSFFLNGSTPMKILHSPIVLKKCHPTNYFKQNKLSNEEQKTISNTDSINGKTIKNITSSSLLFDNLTETTNIENIETKNHSSKDITTCSSPCHKRNHNLSPNSSEKNKITAKLSLPQNKSVTTTDYQETSSRNAKMDISLHKYSLNVNASEPTTTLKSNNRQRVVSLGITNNKTILPVLDYKILKSNNYKCMKNSEPPEKKKYFELLGLNKISHDVIDKNKHIRSPQIKVNGLMIRAPDPNLLNNSALKEKIQEFRLSNKPPENVSSLSEENVQNKCTEKCNNSTTLPEVSESLVSTTTVESVQLDKKIKDCQCNRLRQEVDAQWKIITHLSLRMNSLLNENNYEYESFVKEQSSLVGEEEYISSMLVQKLEDTNKKITEDLRKEQLCNSKLRLTIKNKNNYIRQLENRLRRVSKICEDTEKNATYLRELLNSPCKVRNAILAQNDVIFNL